MTTITINRATVEQALEALESVYGDSCDALHALRAALAQQAKPQGCDHCNHPLYAATKCRVCGRVTEQAEPVEPVAWMDIDSDGQRLSVRMWSDGNSDEVPLYTAPPQRKPLTEEMETRCPYAKANPTLRGAFFDGWLNSERAHGIKE